MEAFSLQGPGTWAFSLQGEAFPLQGEAFSLQDRGFFPSGKGKPCPGGGTWEGETEVALTRHQTPKGSADIFWSPRKILGTLGVFKKASGLVPLA